MVSRPKSIISLRHPSYFTSMSDWEEWRLCYEGGNDYVTRYLQKFCNRETDADFANRKNITPIPSFAKAAVNDVRNSIYQRMTDVLRRGGSKAYMEAVQGVNGGVDLQGSGMDAFMGYKTLTELLVMGRVGVFVDMPASLGPTLADVQGKRPYLYMYPVEDILSWTAARPDEGIGEYKAILLRDTVLDYGEFGDYSINLPIELPAGITERYRLVYIDPMTGWVNVQFFDTSGNPLDQFGQNMTDVAPITLELRKIPFVLLDVGDSLLADTCKHQLALLNLVSSDVAYALKANFPFYTEQRDLRAVGDHLKHGVNPDGTATAGGQGSMDREAQIGVTQGRSYDLRAERPAFIHPSPEPLEASIKLQEKLEDDIRKLVNLAVANKVGRAISAESKDMDNQGLEAGLSFIGLVLETAERKIADFWSSYENRVENRRELAIIKYPARYSLKKDMERIAEATKLSELMTTIPGRSVKKELAKNIVTTLLSGRISVEELDDMYTEIDTADYTTSDPDIIIKAHEGGLVGEKTASTALGFAPEEYLVARKDHAARIERVLKAQTSGKEAQGGMENPAARGIKDLATDAQAGKDEKAASRDTTLQDTTRVPVRGEGKNSQEEE